MIVDQPFYPSEGNSFTDKTSSYSNGLRISKTFNINILSTQYSNSHCAVKTILLLSYLCNGNSYTDQTSCTKSEPQNHTMHIIKSHWPCKTYPSALPRPTVCTAGCSQPPTRPHLSMRNTWAVLILARVFVLWVVWRFNPGKSISTPTAVGLCHYIKVPGVRKPNFGNNLC